MSRSRNNEKPREKLVKFDDKRTGWFGEGCWAAEGRRHIKRLQRRHNRHIVPAIIRRELLES